MASRKLSAAEIAEYEAAVGREQVLGETPTALIALRYAATLGDVRYEEADTLPLGRHWGFYLPVVSPSERGPDGHPRRGGFLPAVRLERRMFAGSRMESLAPFRLGVETLMRSRIRDVSLKEGSAGELVFVEVESRFVQNGREVASELQTLVYLDAPPPQPLPEVLPLPAVEAGWDCEEWRPESVDLFRYSAVTYNGHRIHYDHPYATGVEGYPALVVHGPLIATKLLDLAMRKEGRSARAFQFRARTPCFVDQPIRLEALRGAGGYDLIARRCDGQVAMGAKASF
jgi:3-methylfumaryl-CoA hydratase